MHMQDNVWRCSTLSNTPRLYYHSSQYMSPKATNEVDFTSIRFRLNEAAGAIMPRNGTGWDEVRPLMPTPTTYLEAKATSVS